MAQNRNRGKSKQKKSSISESLAILATMVVFAVFAGPSLMERANNYLAKNPMIEPIVGGAVILALVIWWKSKSSATKAKANAQSGRSKRGREVHNHYHYDAPPPATRKNVLIAALFLATLVSSYFALHSVLPGL